MSMGVSVTSAVGVPMGVPPPSLPYTPPIPLLGTGG